MERILCAAIKINDEIICGFRHGDCYYIYEKLSNKKHDANRLEQGFLTSDNRFVDRKEAWLIAVKQNQVVYGLEASNNELISENLY
jgi:hypothetical protein